MVNTTSFAKVEKGPKQGSDFPHFSVMDIKGKKVDTKQLISQGPLVVLFYRGGWCPYCNRQLQAVNQEVFPKVNAAKGKVIAISVDKPEEGKKSGGNLNDGWHIIADNDAKLVKQFGLDFVVPKKLVKTYKEKYQIDLEASSGRTHHILPVPAIYVVDQKGKITYAYANEDYKVRAANKEVVSALMALKKGS